MQLLGSSESRSSDPSPGGSSTTTETDETPVSTTPADPPPTSATDTDEQSTPEGPMPELQTEGPVNSPPTNDAPYDDPVDGLALTGVTVRVVEERRRDSMLRLDDQLSIGVEDTRFEVRGRGHVEWECDTVGLRTVVVDGRHARVYAETRAIESCRTPDNPAGRGPWAISFTISGRFEGGRADALTASIQGPFIDNSGVFVTKSL